MSFTDLLRVDPGTKPDLAATDTSATPGGIATLRRPRSWRRPRDPWIRNGRKPMRISKIVIPE